MLLHKCYLLVPHPLSRRKHKRKIVFSQIYNIFSENKDILELYMSHTIASSSYCLLSKSPHHNSRFKLEISLIERYMFIG